jgi:hypothetical protein
MKLYDLEQSAQRDISDSGIREIEKPKWQPNQQAKPLFDNTRDFSKIRI